MRFSVCTSALYPELTEHEALARACACGFSAYEFWFWDGIDADKTAAAQQKHGMTPAGLCMPKAPRLDLDPDATFLQGLSDTVALCKKLGCRGIIAQAGDDVPGVPREKQHQGLLEGLKLCTPMAEEAGITVLLEPLNVKIDHEGYYLYAAQEAFDLIDAVGSPAVKVLYDIYHQHITEGVDIPFLQKHMDRIGHFHLAGFPGRHEPMMDDEIDTAGILRAIDESGYQGYVGLEYLPLMEPDESLRQTLSRLQSIFK